MKIVLDAQLLFFVIAEDKVVLTQKTLVVKKNNKHGSIYHLKAACFTPNVIDNDIEFFFRVKFKTNIAIFMNISDLLTLE